MKKDVLKKYSLTYFTIDIDDIYFVVNWFSWNELSSEDVSLLPNDGDGLGRTVQADAGGQARPFCRRDGHFGKIRVHVRNKISACVSARSHTSRLTLLYIVLPPSYVIGMLYPEALHKCGSFSLLDWQILSSTPYG